MPSTALRTILTLLLVVACGPSEGTGSDTKSASESTDTAGTTVATEGSTGSDTEGSTGSEGTTDSGADTEGSTDSGADTEGFAGVDLTTCGLASECPPMYDHLGPEPADALLCAAMLVASGESGAIVGYHNIGPSPDTTETFVVLLGDGTAIAQDRVAPNATDPGDVDAWTLLNHRICDVSAPQVMIDACAMDPAGAACSWTVWSGLTNCVEAELTCVDLGG